MFADFKPGPFCGFIKRSGGGWEAVALFKPLGRPNARYSARRTSWARDRADALESLRVMSRPRP